MAVVYCNRCGAENQATRGACLRCFNPLDWPAGGLTCGACGAQNAQEARYCAACSDVLVDLPPMPPCTRDEAITLILGAEDEMVGADEEDFIGGAGEEEIAPADVPEVDFEEAEEEEFEAPAPPPPPAAEAAGLMAAAAAPPPPPPAPEEISLDEEAEEAEEPLFEPAGAFAPPPPPPDIDDIHLDDESAAADELDAELPEFAPVGGEDEGPLFEPVAPAADLDFELEETEEPAPAEEEPAADEKKPKDKEDELGGWVIDFDDEK